MTFFDFAVLLIVFASVLLGFLRGVVSEALSLAAWVLSILLAKMLAPQFAPEFSQWIFEPNLQYLAAFSAILVLVLVVAAITKLLAKSLLRATGLGTVDRFLGIVFGLMRGIFLVMLLIAASGLTLIPRQTWWREAVLSAPLETVVIALKPWLPQQWASKIRYR